MKNFIQRSFRRELLVSFLAVSVLPLIVCCVFLIQMFKVKVGRDFEKKDMELAGAVEQQLMTLFDAYHDAAEELCTDPLAILFLRAAFAAPIFMLSFVSV